MSSMLKLKRLAERIPPPAGRLLSLIPYSWRLGPAYNRARRDIDTYARLSTEERKHFIFERVQHELLCAFRDNPFYRSFYSRRGFDPIIRWPF